MIFFLPGFLQSSLEFILCSGVSVLQKNRMNRVCVCVCVYIYRQHLLYPFLHQWTFTLLPFLGYCKQCSNEHWGTCIFWIMFFSRYVPMSGTARSYGRSVFSFLRNLHIVLRSGCTNLHSHKQCWKLLSWSHPL